MSITNSNQRRAPLCRFVILALVSFAFFAPASPSAARRLSLRRARNLPQPQGGVQKALGLFFHEATGSVPSDAAQVPATGTPTHQARETRPRAPSEEPEIPEHQEAGRGSDGRTRVLR